MFPAMVVLILGLIIPLYNAVELSFYDWSMGTPWETREFLGFDAYVRMFNDEAVYQSVSVTLRYTFWVLVTEMVLGTALALLLEKPVRGAAVFRTIFILPLMVSPVAVGLIWRYLYDARIGLINYFLESIGEAIPFLQYLGFTRQLWLADPDMALTSIIITDIWQWTPFIFIILPMIRTIIMVTLLLRIIDVFRALEVIYTMTFGGPGLSTEVLSLHIYKTAFTAQQLGYASTIATLLMAIILVFTILALIYQNPLKETAEY